MKKNFITYNLNLNFACILSSAQMEKMTTGDEIDDEDRPPSQNLSDRAKVFRDEVISIFQIKEFPKYYLHQKEKGNSSFITCFFDSDDALDERQFVTCMDNCWCAGRMLLWLDRKASRIFRTNYITHKFSWRNFDACFKNVYTTANYVIPNSW